MATLKLPNKEDESEIPAWEDRTKEWKDDTAVSKQLEDIYSAVVSGFGDKSDQTQTIERAWEVYNCVLNEGQMYNGDSKIYLPIARDAIEARVTRYSNSIFPQTGRYSEVLSNDAEVPYETMAVLDHYVEACSLRENIIPATLRSGDITGQYSLYVSWLKNKRHTIKKVQTPELGNDMAGVLSAKTIPDVAIEEVDDSRPDVLVLDPRDLLVMPASVDDIEDADTVAIALRLSKGKIQEMIDSEEIDEEAGEDLIETMSSGSDKQQSDSSKKNLNAAGVQNDSKGNKTVLVYMVWTKLKIGGKRRRCVAYLAGADNILTCKRNPYWSDRIPVISQAALKVNGSFWGRSRVEAIEKSQYAANDAFNMGLDSIKYSLMPIIAVDPERNPRSGTIVITMGAVWQVDPDSMRVVEFPVQWNEAQQVVSECRGQIMQTLGTNNSMMLMGGSGKNPTQAQIAQEQQVALESTADVVTILENSVLNKLLRWFYEMDYQFRDKAISVRRFGPVGLQAEMQEVPPVGVDTHYVFKWYGTEGNKSAQQIQQMISMLNVMQNLPPQMLNGRTIDAGPIIEQAANVTFGPRVAPRVLIDARHKLTIPADVEGDMMKQGFCVTVQPLDNDAEHIQVHTMAAQETGDPTGEIRIHIMEHMNAMKEKNAQMNPPPAPSPQGGGPRPGAQVQPPTGVQNPPGAVHPDQMQGVMPRQRGML